MPDASKKPDAVMGPRGVLRGATIDKRVVAAAEVVEPILGGRAHIRPQGDRYFATRDLSDSLCFPKDHILAGQERYDWSDGPNGLRLGFLKPEALPESAAPVAQSAAVDPAEDRASKAAKLVGTGVLKPEEVPPEIQAHPTYQAAVGDAPEAGTATGATS